jgi:hypothetical protein
MRTAQWPSFAQNVIGGGAGEGVGAHGGAGTHWRMLSSAPLLTPT